MELMILVLGCLNVGLLVLLGFVLWVQERERKENNRRDIVALALAQQPKNAAAIVRAAYPHGTSVVDEVPDSGKPGVFS